MALVEDGALLGSRQLDMGNSGVREKADDLDRRVEEMQEVLARYHRLATLGNLVDIVLHDGRAPLSKISQAAFVARRDIGRTQEHSTVTFERVRERLDIVGTQAEVLATVLRRIEPFGGRKRGRPVQIDVERVIRDAFSVLSSEILRLGVEVDLPQGSTKVTVDPSEIQEVIVNLLMNSLYWLGPIEKKNRHIKVEISKKTLIPS